MLSAELRWWRRSITRRWYQAGKPKIFKHELPFGFSRCRRRENESNGETSDSEGSLQRGVERGTFPAAKPNIAQLARSGASLSGVSPLGTRYSNSLWRWACDGKSHLCG